MKQSIKDFKLALKDFEMMVKNPQYLWNGRDIKNFSLRPREAWANWLICVVLMYMYKKPFTFMEDSETDGIIIDIDNNISFPTEHVSALYIPKINDNIPMGDKKIIDAINHKIERGKKYAKGKILVVFFDGDGLYHRNKIREAIYNKHGFEAVFCICLCKNKEDAYSYYVTEFRDSFKNESITHKVDINKDFTNWKVNQMLDEKINSNLI